MINDPRYWDGLLHDVEAVLEEVEPTWRERWASMAGVEKTHLLNVDMLDVDRYLGKLQDARGRKLLTHPQVGRLARAIVARERAQATIAAMVIQVEDEQRTRLRA